MDPHANSQKLNGGDLAISTTSFDLAVTEVLTTVYRAKKGVQVQNRISTSDNSDMSSSKSRAQDIRNLLEDLLKKLAKEMEERFKKSLPKKQKIIRNLKEADDEEIDSEILELFLGIPKGAGLVGCLLPSPVATLCLPLSSIGATALSCSRASGTSAIRQRTEIMKYQKALNKVINPMDEESRRQVLKQLIFPTALIGMVLLIGMYFTEFEKTRGKKTKTCCSCHPQCGCHCSSFQHGCYTTFFVPQCFSMTHLLAVDLLIELEM